VCGAGAAITASLDAAQTSTQLTMRTSSRGLVVSARATFPAPSGLDLTQAVSMTLRDENGGLLFEKTVRGSEFATRPGQRAVYRENGRVEGGGFTVLELRAHGGRGKLTVRALLSPVARDTAAVDDGAAFEAMRMGSPSATLDWLVRSADGCVNGSGQCQGRARRCR
jgi:hypothetical protein